MLVIGLTGGIGSGKSTVADYFKQLGIPVLDADQVTRDLIATHPSLLTQMVNHFGSDILTATGALDRSKLRHIIFKSPPEREWLEQCLHPLVIQTMQDWIATLKAPYCILVIPLLFETAAEQLINRSLIVDIPETVQVTRTQQRDRCSIEAVKAIMQTQISRQQRLALADDVINNDQGLKELERQVKKMHEFYCTLST